MIQFWEKLRKDGRTDGQTDKGEFIEPQSAKAGVQLEGLLEPILRKVINGRTD